MKPSDSSSPTRKEKKLANTQIINIKIPVGVFVGFLDGLYVGFCVGRVVGCLVGFAGIHNRNV
jgi:hypothetical protein